MKAAAIAAFIVSCFLANAMIVGFALVLIAIAGLFVCSGWLGMRLAEGFWRRLFKEFL